VNKLFIALVVIGAAFAAEEVIQTI
jgi:hypothetical protein